MSNYLNYIAVLESGDSTSKSTALLLRGMGVFTKIIFLDEIDNLDSFVKGIIIRDNKKNSKIYKELINRGVKCLLINDETSKDNIRSFISSCQISSDWSSKTFIEQQISNISNTVGDKRVLCALSGGVDSAVTAVLIHKAIGDKLKCIFVDTGLMRLNERENIQKIFNEKFNLDIIFVNSEGLFLEALKDVDDPEKKRKIIGELFIRVFEKEALKYGDFDYLAQGTLYTDVLESKVNSGIVAVKSHHNVGGLPKNFNFKLIEPLKDLFKDEVRSVGLELGIPKDIIMRHPFPGPGLAVRIIGGITKEMCDILRRADSIALDRLKKTGYYSKVWQAFCVLLPIMSVGIKNNKRVYGYTIVFRCINSIDGTTAEWSDIPRDILEDISKSITDGVEEVNRVVYDITSKPPATIEWE